MQESRDEVWCFPDDVPGEIRRQQGIAVPPGKVVTMSIWIGIAASAVVALSLLMGLIIGRILRVIGREVAELMEAGSPHTRVTLSPVRALETEIVRSRPKELVTN